MSKPGTPDRHGMIDRLKYGRLADPAELTEAQRRQLADDPELAVELQLNRALKLGRPEIPELDNPVKLVDKAVDLAHRGEQPQLAPRWRWSTAAFALGVVAVLVIVALQLPFNVNRTDDGVRVTVESAWATGNGYLLDYTILFDEPYTGTSADSADHPLWRVYRALRDWSAAHPESGTPDGGPAASLEIASGNLDYTGQSAFIYSFYVKVFSASEEELAGLTDLLAEVPELSEPEVDEECWYFNEAIPDTYFTGQTVVINGKSYNYPVEIDTDCLEMLEVLLHFSGEAGQLYFALDDIPEYRRYGLGDVVKVWWPDDLTVEFENYPVELDFQSLGLPSWWHSINVYVPANEVDIEFDPVKLIQAYAATGHSNLSSGGNGMPGFGDEVVVPLIPDERWLTVSQEDCAAAMDATELNSVQVLTSKLDDLVATARREHPDAAEPLISSRVVYYGSVPTHWVAGILLDNNERILVRMAGQLRDLGIEDYRILPKAPDRTIAQHFKEAANRPKIPRAVVIWMFLPQSRWQAIPREDRSTGLREEFTAEEINKANAQAEVVERVYREWLAANPVLNARVQGDPIPADSAMKAKLLPNTDGGVTMSVYVSVLDEDRDAAQAWIDELVAMVQATGEVATEPTMRMETTSYFPIE